MANNNCIVVIISTNLAFCGPTDFASYDELADMAWSGILPSSIPKADRHSPRTKRENTEDSLNVDKRCYIIVKIGKR